MSVENQNDLPDENLSDVFNQMADTFDKESGLIKDPESSDAEENHEELKTETTEEPAASAQQANQQEDVFDFNALPADRAVFELS